MEKKQAAAWYGKSKNGHDQLMVEIGGERFYLYRNKFKDKETKPDWKTIQDKPLDPPKPSDEKLPF